MSNTLWVVGSIAFAALMAIGAPILIGRLNRLTIVQQLYYRPVAQRIMHNAAFARELGSPISIDDENVGCDAVENGRYESTADCTIPVKGSRQSAYVHAQIDAKPSSIQTDLFLHIGSRVVEAHEND